LNRNRLLAIWLFSIVALAIFAGQNWGSFEVSLAAGGGTLGVSGYAAFPVLGTLVGLQLIAVLLSLLSRPIVSRFLSSAIAIVMAWSVFLVLTSASEQIFFTAQRELAEKTGVLQDLASSDFVISSAVSSWSVVYLAAGSLNIIILGMIALFWRERSVAKKAKRDVEQPEDLWGDQK
jgi:hypothetical protein